MVFIPQLPEKQVDMIYLCFPNNPTGTVISKAELKNGLIMLKRINLLLFMIVHMKPIFKMRIFLIVYMKLRGAKEVAIEFKSYSKSAGFTGIRYWLYCST